MSEAWIRLKCPNCEETWEASPSDLPSPDRKFTCRHCGVTHQTVEFARSNRDFEILKRFHEE